MVKKIMETAYAILVLLQSEHNEAGCQRPPEFPTCSVCERIEQFAKILEELQSKE
jgi:hypothetical protein